MSHGRLCWSPTSVPRRRARLAYIVQGHLQRVRVIAIDAGSDRALSGLDTRLERISEATLIAILEANFPVVPSDHLRAYVALSSGFVRLAADLCERDALITAAGHLGPVLDSVDQYLQRRLSDQQLTVVQALSLVTRVGYKHDVARELDDLCALTGLDRGTALSVADRLHDVPGFVARAGRYRYTTPEIVAQAAFERAWRRWCEDDPDTFLGKLPASLLEPFINRVRNSASEEVRRRVGDYFRHWAAGYAPGQLANPATIHALVTLTELDPSVYLPQLRSVIARARRGDPGDQWSASWPRDGAALPGVARREASRFPRVLWRCRSNLAASGGRGERAPYREQCDKDVAAVVPHHTFGNRPAICATTTLAARSRLFRRSSCVVAWACRSRLPIRAFLIPSGRTAHGSRAHTARRMEPRVFGGMGGCSRPCRGPPCRRGSRISALWHRTAQNRRQARANLAGREAPGRPGDAL